MIGVEPRSFSIIEVEDPCQLHTGVGARLFLFLFLFLFQNRTYAGSKKKSPRADGAMVELELVELMIRV